MGLDMSHRQRPGFSLVELLITLVVMMIMIGALARFFKYVGDTVAEGRALLALTADLHARRVMLERELANATTTSVARIGSANLGYLEIIEGTDSYDDSTSSGTDSVFGDVDDVLAFTVRSIDKPFRGQLLYFTKMPDPATQSSSFPKTVYALDNILPPGSSAPTSYSAETLESDTAEIVYWLTLDDKNGNGTRDYGEYYVLRRRVLLVRPDVILNASYGLMSYPYGPANGTSVFTIADLSLRRVGNSWATNDLATLARRENRFGRNGSPLGVVGGGGAAGPGPFPSYMLEPKHLPRLKDVTLPALAGIPRYTVYRRDEDVVLTNVVAFDVQVFDSQAPLYEDRGGAGGSSSAPVVVGPADPGYGPPVVGSGQVVGFGAFLDVGTSVTNPLTGNLTPFGQQSWLQQRFSNLLQNAGISPKAVYDTWSLSYDRDGIDQMNDGSVDTGTDGIDNNGNGLVDELAEYEAPPPYTAPLRGIKIILRVIDPDTRQVAQTTIIADFTPY